MPSLIDSVQNSTEFQLMLGKTLANQSCNGCGEKLTSFRILLVKPVVMPVAIDEDGAPLFGRPYEPGYNDDEPHAVYAIGVRCQCGHQLLPHDSWTEERAAFAKDVCAALGLKGADQAAGASVRDLYGPYGDRPPAFHRGVSAYSIAVGTSSRDDARFGRTVNGVREQTAS